MRLADLPKLCGQNNMPAVAIIDNNNLFGALEFSTVATKNGIQPINGCQFTLLEPSEEKAEVVGSIVLLAQDETGYRNLLRLNSCLYLGAEYGPVGVSWQQLRQYSDGLICLTGGAEGPVSRLVADGRREDAAIVLDKLAATYPRRLYVELQRHASEESNYSIQEIATEPLLLQLAYAANLPLVATNDVYFPNREMFAAHDALICIPQNAYVDQVTGRRSLTPEHYFKSTEDMVELFADIPEAISNTLEIARRCSYWAMPREPILPKFADDEAQELRKQSHDGLTKRLSMIQPAESEETYWNRLEYELGVIEGMGFAGYFLIVADFIKWAKQKGIPVGPGRGSGAGSLVAYALTITDLDPLRFDLIFERFLNPERISMPDFDVDFCQERRDEVIRYVQEKYGEDRVAHIITFGALLSRGAVRDVGRVLRVPYPKADTIAKLIPRDGARNVPVDEALDTEPKLREMRDTDEQIARLFEYAKALEGLLRNASTHAAGVVIGDRPLDELVPLYRDAKSTIPATQFSMKWVEKAGLVKFDFLGLKTLTAIKKAVDLLARRGVQVDIGNLPLDDEKTFKMCTAAETVAVFQLESAGMKDTLRRLKPTRIEDIVALVALYRPGPMDNIPTYCDVKNGIKGRTKQHKSIDAIVAETHGIMVYQEQVMQIARSMSGYSLGQADLLRRAIGKKVRSDMDAEMPKFLEGAESNGVSRGIAQKVWDLMAKFAEYGFPKAHAAAYALVSYQTAWLKANHPVEFMASVMSCDINDTDKLKSFAHELRRLKVELLPPSINHSEVDFSVQDGKVVYGLSALRSVGAEAVSGIINKRKGNPYKSLFDFASRVELKKIGKRQLEVLVCAGALDCLEPNRHRIFESIDLITSYSQAVHTELESGQTSLFGEDDKEIPPPAIAAVEDWNALERAERELSAIGFYLSDHPLDGIFPQLREKGVELHSEVLSRLDTKPGKYLLAGYVSRIDYRTARSGNKFAFVELSDPSGSFEIAVFSDLLVKCGAELTVGVCVKAVVTGNLENDQTKFKTEVLEFLDVAEESNDTKIVNQLTIHFKDPNAPKRVRDLLESRCRGAKRKGAICFSPWISDIDYEVEILTPELYSLNPKVKNAIASLDGVAKVAAS